MVFNGAQFHLLVNHLPVIGFLGVVLALAIATKVESLDIKRFVLLAGLVRDLSWLDGGLKWSWYEAFFASHGKV